MMMANRRLYLIALNVLVLTVFVSLLTVQTGAQEQPFHFGLDLSYVNEMEDCGAVYRENGEPRDPFELFAEHGATLVRARLWHNPDWTVYSTLDDVKRTFQRTQDAGMATLLDFHYSDNWADPGRQEIPLAWQDIEDTEALAEAVYAYTYSVLAELHNEDLTPAYVQVGNETNAGILLRNTGERSWSRDAVLFNAGIRAVRDFAQSTDTDPQIILHIAQPENTTWWFTEAERAGITDFDVIGISYYPQWSTFSIGDLGAQVTDLRLRFGKEVMIVETAYGWTREAVRETASNILNQGLLGYPFTPEGQRRFMTDLTQSLISNGAAGVVYWEPAWVSTGCSTRWGQGSHWENATFFDFQNDNELLEVIEFLTADYHYPPTENLADGVIESAYGDPLLEDGTGDVLNDVAALDLDQLYVRVDGDTLMLAVTLAGDIFSQEGSYLIYFDTTHDDQGADVDVGRRPIVAADPYKPEYRLDISITGERSTTRGSYTLNAWIDHRWTAVTFTGGAAILPGEPSVIELQIPLTLLNHPERLNLAVISTDRGRARSASDILGTGTVPPESPDALVLDQFIEVDLLER
jgi:arabinogalactan endo-1,4-beta-galactosidase